MSRENNEKGFIRFMVDRSLQMRARSIWGEEMVKLLTLASLLGVTNPAWAEDVATVDVVSDEQVASVKHLRFTEVTTLKMRRVVVPPWSKLQRPIVCKLDFEVDGAGVPSAVVPVECPDELHRNAVKSAMGWKFEPYLEQGEAVPVRFRVVLKINH